MIKMHIALLLIVPLFITGADGLTCYNGMKMLSLQNVGESTEECSDSGAYCYNMTASAMLLVDVVKAGCSTWRCMFAKDRCISTYFQMIPVSLCCCSHDRCNVGGNPTGAIGMGNNNNNDPNANFANNYDSNNNYPAYDNQQQKSNWGSSWASPDSAGTAPPATTQKWSKKDVEDRFKNFDVDHRPTGSTGGAEESFVKVDAFSTTKRPNVAGSRADRVQSQPRDSDRGAEVTIP